MTTRSVALGVLAEFLGGGTPSKSNPRFYEGDIPWVSPKDMKSWIISDSEDHITAEAVQNSATRIVPPASILIVNRSGILKRTLPVGITSREVAINQDLKALVCKPSAHPPYVARMIAAAEPIVLGWVRATTADNFPIENLKNLEIPLPPLEEQKRIAAILDQADELRRKRQRALDRLNQLGQAIFIEMFGDLGASGIDVEPLGSVTSKIGSGATPKGGDSAYKAEGIPLIRSMNVRDGHFLDKGLAFIDDEQASKLDNVVVKGGDVLLNITGASVARVCTAPTSMDGARVNQHVSIIRPTPRLLSVYVEAYLLLPMIKRKLLNIAESGATRQAITKAQIEQLTIPVPNIRKQQEFAERVGVVQQALENASMNHGHLVSLFGSLQHRAFSGELTASSPKVSAK